MCEFQAGGRTMKTLADRFWEKVHVCPEGCWEWTGAVGSAGYGNIGERENSINHTLQTHRLSWMIHFGEIPDGLWVLHHCDNRACVRPDHLFLGTCQDNHDDCAAKGRNRVGEKAGMSKLTIADVREIRKLEGLFTHKKIAANYGVSRSNIGQILSGKTWRNYV